MKYLVENFPYLALYHDIESTQLKKYCNWTNSIYLVIRTSMCYAKNQLTSLLDPRKH